MYIIHFRSLVIKASSLLPSSWSPRVSVRDKKAEGSYNVRQVCQPDRLGAKYCFKYFYECTASSIKYYHHFYIIVCTIVHVSLRLFGSRLLFPIFIWIYCFQHFLWTCSFQYFLWTNCFQYLYECTASSICIKVLPPFLHHSTYMCQPDRLEANYCF